MINNRQNGRRRGRGNGGNNNQRGGNPGRPDSGNRIDNRARGNANQLYEKYKNLARDAQMSGDRVNTEYYLQFADHYFRVLSESRLRFEEQNPNAAPQRRIQPVDSFDDFDDADDYGDEGEPIRAGEQDMRDQQGGQQGQQGGQRYNGQQGGNQQGGGQQGGRDRDNGQRDYRENGRDNARDNGNRPPRYEGRRDERGDGNRFEPRRNGRDPGQEGEQAADDRFAVTGSPIANDLGEDAPDGAEPTPIEGRRRGRPRRPVAEGDAGVAAFDADRLPPSLSVVGGAGAEAGDEGSADEAPRPRRRRPRAAGEAPTLG